MRLSRDREGRLLKGLLILSFFKERNDETNSCPCGSDEHCVDGALVEAKAACQKIQ